MTSTGPEPSFDGARGEVSARFDGLSAALEAADGRLGKDVLAPARELDERAGSRLRLSGEHTIVALAGATGSGKSSLFNQLTDLELAGVGVRRPTTSWALACAWGPDGAQELLEWMGIPARHQVSRMSMLDRSADDQKLDGLVLLDLPDHDSTEVSHHLEMDRLVRYADVLVWVLDPQKYADAAIHDRYIKPMAEYRDVTVVVLNQIDRIHYEQRERALEDVRRILADEGLPDVTVIGVSATRGDGVDDLKRELARRIRAKHSAQDRLTSDLDATAQAVASAGGTAEVPGVGPTDEDALDLGLLDAAGIPQLVSAIEASSRRRALQHTSWLPLRPLTSRRRPSPEALGLDADLSPAQLSRTTAVTSRVQRSQVEGAVREIAERASVGLERPWRDAVRDASLSRADTVITSLDDAVSGSDLALDRTPLWWRVAGALQWLALLALVGGVVWGVLVVAGVLDTPSQVGGLDLPWFVAIAGLVGGVVLAVVGRLAGFLGSRRRARKAEERLCADVVRIGREQVLAPVNAELGRYGRFRTGILRAQK
ncbi:hypothetical protein ASD11_03255 [Aeromicrobium sp. Root495]|uniref:GTPase n=1 Tax=Aeromicrobium sp. Root495 TaxID=1736550 RepID=UPI0006F78D07|nr:GTPase [Aeromicrobium sp. Root495]KQY58682.1 hypothetical protein ASD11_03255 [Aeromicrobium sp. Root495]